MQKLSLIEAIINIVDTLHIDNIQGIQYEDGSGYKFNYFHLGEWKFIDLSNKPNFIVIDEITSHVYTKKAVESRAEI